METDLCRPPVTVVIPAFNEAHRLPSSLPVLCETLCRLDLSHAEVIVVDDGSDDGTASLARDLLSDLPNARVVSLCRNTGKGAAVRAGIAEASGDAIVFMDADLASDLTELPKLLAALDDAEVALGSRRTGRRADRSAVRRAGSWLFHLVCRLLIPLGLADTQCGFKAFRHAEAKLLFGLSQISGFAFDIEVLALARSLGYRIAEVPVRWTEKPGGKFHVLRHTPQVLADLVRVRRRVPQGRARPAWALPAQAAFPAAAGAPEGHVPPAGPEGTDPFPRAHGNAPGPPPSPGPAPPPRGTQPGAAASAPAPRTPWWNLPWIAAAFCGLLLAQQPGRVTADTKIELTRAPTRLLAGAPHLWTAAAGFGHLPSKQAGYLFPTSPLLAAGHLLHLPPWVVQRLWMALTLTLATWGVVRLADTLRAGRPLTRVVGGLAYTLGPTAAATTGSASAMTLGAAMLPWMVVPLFRALRPDGAGGDVTGPGAERAVPDPGRARGRGDRSPAAAGQRLSPRRAAALSGLAVLGIGGANGTVTASLLLCPATVLLLAGGGRRAWALRAWWVAAVVIATAWWSVGLVSLGAYGLEFLPFTEPAPARAGEAIRGTGHPTAYLGLPNAWVPAVADRAGSAFVIAGSAVAAAVALWALARRDRIPRTAPTRPAGPAAPGERRALTAAEQVLLASDRRGYSVLVALLGRTDGRLDAGAVAAGAAEVFGRHPVTQAALRNRSGAWGWRIPRPPCPPRVGEISVAGPDEAWAALREMLDEGIDVRRAPLVRLLVAHHPDGDWLALVGHHLAVDGRALLTLLAETFAAYTPGACQARTAVVDPTPPCAPRRGRRVARAWVSRVVARPSRFLVPEGPTGLTGCGVQARMIAAPRPAPRADGRLATVNDVLVAAAHLAVARWNDAHGAPIGVSRVRVSTREHGPGELDGLSSGHGITRAGPACRAQPGGLLGAVMDQTTALKDRRPTGPFRRRRPVETALALVPARARAAALRFAVSAARPILMPTMAVSNLGHVPVGLRAGIGGPRLVEAHLTATTRMPQGVSLLVSRAGDRVHLTFCHARELFGDAAARRFVDLYLDAVAEIAAAIPTGPVPAAANESGRACATPVALPVRADSPPPALPRAAAALDGQNAAGPHAC